MAPPCSNEQRIDSPMLKTAVAVALLRFGRLHGATHSRSPSAVRWKQKAKERKRELLRLREELKLLQDGMQCDVEPLIASCRCHFFDGCGELQQNDRDGGSSDEHWIDQVLRRRFLRLLRWKERKKKVDGCLERRNFVEFKNEDEVERLHISIDFLVDLSDNVVSKGEVDSSFSTFSHQAVDFILASLKNVVSSEMESELLEEIVNGLIMRLVRRMCTDPNNNCNLDAGSMECILDVQSCVQHLIRKLGSDPFVGHRIILLVSQKISIAAESLLFMDPFDDTFPGIHGSMFMMIQLLEFLISDYLKSWMSCEYFDKRIFEEWVRSILKARKDVELLETMNGLYVIYMERVTGQLASVAAPATHQGKLDLETFSKLLS